ncbi:tRNA lysidine(34) synthetase TilS [Candidatus Bipolaricaulota bacterium]|nr:tRNA lysidine(34) synthetase TilS [Candidatus Bipolaricaulota bacterium]
MVLESIKNFLKDHSIEGNSLLVAVSGGVDSTVLLDCLVKLGADYSLDLTVAHLDHGLRGGDSRGDLEHVREKAGNLGLKCITERRPVRKKIKDQNLSLEEAARKIRYDFLRETAEKTGADFVALGHNRNDQAETVLMHLLRGCGLRGLSGMKEVSGNYIRPLLRSSRSEILDYAESNELEYRKDKTNKDTTYFRNKIRHDLLPELEKNYNRRIVDHLVQTGKLAREAQSYFEQKVEEISAGILISEEQGKCFSRTELLKHHRYIQKKIIRKFIRDVKGNLKDINTIHVKEIIDKIRNEPARTRLDLPGVVFKLSRDRACFFHEFINSQSKDYYYETTPDGSLVIEEADLEIRFELNKNPEGISSDDFSSDNLTEVVDWSKVEQPIIVRNRNEGDKFVPLGMEGTKRLKDFFIDTKIPYEERNGVPLVCDDSGIIWVVGHRIDDRYKLDKFTNEALLMKAREI